MWSHVATAFCRSARRGSKLEGLARSKPRFRRPLRLESLETRWVLSHFSHTFTDISPNNSDLDAADPDGASMGRVNGLANVAGDSQTYYAASEYGGLYKTTDQGLNWVHLDGHLPQLTWDVEVDPSNPNRVYATSFYDGRVKPITGIQVSTDGGATWAHPLTAHADLALEGTINDNTPQGAYGALTARRDEPAAYGIAIRPDAPNNVAIGTNAGLAISNDSGVTWQIVDPTPATNATNVWDAVWQPGGPQGLGILDVVGDDGHQRSVDGGVTWTANNLPGGAFGAAGSSISIGASPDESYVLYVVGIDNNLYESIDAGATWTLIGASDPVRGGGRLPFIAINDTTAGFDLWTGGVSLYRAVGTTPANPMQGVGGSRITAPANWFGGFTRGGIGAATGAHDDVGDIVFDGSQAIDAVPRIFSNDGGVYFAQTTSAAPTGTGNLVWEQPTVGPHAEWLFGMTSLDRATLNDEDIYYGTQDIGSFGNTQAGAANPAASWHNEDCCDVFDLAADNNGTLANAADDTVLYTMGAFGTGRQFRLFLGDSGLQNSAEINTYPGNVGSGATMAASGGQVTSFNFSESIARFGNASYAVLMNDDGAFGDGGLHITTNINANPIVWTELGNATEPASNNFGELQVAIDGGGNVSFFVTVGDGNGYTADQLWRFNGTNAAGAWQRLDTNIDGGTGGVSLFAVDPNNPNRLYASFIDPITGPRMVFSNDGGATWQNDPNLDVLMTAGGAFQYQPQRGPRNFPDQENSGAPARGVGVYFQPTLLAFDPEDSNIIVAGGMDSGVFITTDGGATWRLLTDPLGTDDDLTTTQAGGLPLDDVPHIPRPRFAHFDHERAGNIVDVYVGTQGRGVWRIGVNFDLDPDTFETNDTLAAATVLGSLPKITLRDLTIHNPADVDFFQYTAQDTGKLIVNMFHDQQGELDLQVRDARGNLVAVASEQTLETGLVGEQLVIPVVSQEQYFIEVFSAASHTNAYNLEIENFPAPIPAPVVLDPPDDSGMMDNDNITSEDQPRVFVQADLSDFAAMGISILSAAQAAAAQTAGAAVEVFRNGVAQGFANVVPGSDSTLFNFTFGAFDLAEGVNFLTAAVRIFDGQRDAVGNPQPAQGRSQLSEPLLLRLDTTAPLTPAAPDLLASSDTGMFDNDNVTNKMQPAFSGTTERNAKVRVKADGVVVGQGVAASGGAWEVTVEPLADGVYDITVEVEDAAGNVSAMSSALEIEIDTLAPNTPHLDLVEASDSGRHNDDNITNDNTPDLSATTQDPNAASHLLADNLKYRIFDRLENFAEVLAFQSLALTSDTQVTTTLAALADGIHNLKLEVEDRAGNISHDFLLDALIDTVAPTGTVNLHPDSDTGIWGFPETMGDGITQDKVPLLYGATEANALVRVALDIDDNPPDGIPDGTTVALPYDGDDAFPPPPEFDGNYFLQTIQMLSDGEHTLTAFFQDVAGNETAADDAPELTIFVDSQGPKITNVTRGEVSVDNEFDFDGETSVFEPKPSETGPDPLVHSIVVHFSDLPDRTAAFDYDALLAALAEEEGNYSLKGDHNGYIAITAVNVTFTTIPDDGLPETAEVELVFDQPLPDDRYTLWVSDNIMDPAGNALDGESGALGPFDGEDVPDETPPIFPTGDGAHGGDFHGRFTVDSRPEIGTFALGSIYLDINGNQVFDAEGKDRDYTNRDITFLFGFRDDRVFAGNFAAVGDPATGYDKLGGYGNAGQGPAWRWRLDFDHDGVVDYDVLSGVQTQGDPVAGDFTNAHDGDEIGLFNAGKWFLDTGGDNNIGGPGDTQLNGNMRGQPIVGDFDGDGLDDLGTWDPGNAGTQFDGVFQFDLAANGFTGDAERTIQFDVPGVFQKAVAADMNGDGIDDLGLFVTRREGVPPAEAAEWFWLISDRNNPQGVAPGEVYALAHPFTPVPFGSDIYAQFGDEAALPVVGNFDPPTSPPNNPPDTITIVEDIDRDGVLRVADLLPLIQHLRTHAVGPYGDSRLDPDGDGQVTILDLLAVVQAIRQTLQGEGEANSDAALTPHAQPAGEAAPTIPAVVIVEQPAAPALEDNAASEDAPPPAPQVALPPNSQPVPVTGGSGGGGAATSTSSLDEEANDEFFADENNLELLMTGEDA